MVKNLDKGAKYKSLFIRFDKVNKIRTSQPVSD